MKTLLHHTDELLGIRYETWLEVDPLANPILRPDGEFIREDGQVFRDLTSGRIIGKIYVFQEEFWIDSKYCRPYRATQVQSGSIDIGDHQQSYRLESLVGFESLEQAQEFLFKTYQGTEILDVPQCQNCSHFLGGWCHYPDSYRRVAYDDACIRFDGLTVEVISDYSGDPF